MPSERQSILWVDDEIDLLRPHILYLESKGYQVTGTTNGFDALDLVEKARFDVVLLDEMMPGMGGLEVLDGIKARRPRLPVIMITKSEEENLMNEALGHKISDYLIKPVKPSQIFLACKKIFEAGALERGATVRDYVRELGEDDDEEADAPGWEGWVNRYRRDLRWELELDRIDEASLRQSHGARIEDLNRRFCRQVEADYPKWLASRDAASPLMLPRVLPERVAPHLKAGRKVALIVIDCLRLDEWLMFEPLLPPEIHVELDVACSILPTATAYARNALFSGMLPREIARVYPEFWIEIPHADETNRNLYEKEMLLGTLRDHGVSRERVQYRKVVRRRDAEELTRQMGSFTDLDLVSLVFTFVDTFTHGRSRDAILAEFAHDAAALRAHLQTWFERSIVLQVIREMARQGRVTMVTTDHGSMQVRRPSLIHGDRQTSSGVRFKFGKALRCRPDDALLVSDPEVFGLPGGGVLKNYVFAKGDCFFVYSKRRHDYERQLRGSFQHGGISLEEMMLPLATLWPR